MISTLWWNDFDGDHQTEVTVGTSWSSGVLLDCGAWNASLTELLACELDGTGAHAIDEQTEVSNADEPLGQDVEQVTRRNSSASSSRSSRDRHPGNP